MKTRPSIQIDALESRTLLHGGFGHGGFGGGDDFGGHGLGHLRIPANPDAAVTQDLANISADRTQLQTDRTNLKSTLQADRQAIRDAIRALDTTIAPLRTTFQQDASTWRATLRTDRQAIRSAADDAARQTAIDQFKADATSAQAVLLADAQNIKNAIDNDPTVANARTQLTTDSQSIADDEAKLKADVDQLRTDIAAQNAGSTTVTPSSKHRRH